MLSPIEQANPFAYSCSFTLHTSYTNDILDQAGGGGGAVKTLKNNLL